MSVDEGITVYDKTTNEAYEDFIQFEDRGDIGNEYIYFQPKGTEPIFAQLKGYEVLENNARYAKVLLKHDLTIPVSADESTAGESDIPVNFGGVTFFPRRLYLRRSDRNYTFARALRFR